MEVIILAMGETRALCPFDAEVWSVNNGYRQLITCYDCYIQKQKLVKLQIKSNRAVCPHCNKEWPIPRIDKIFLAHTQCWDAEGDPVFNWAELNHLADRGVEIINTHRVKGLKAKLFPMKSLVGKFGRSYFSDSIAYMVAYALYKGYAKIRLYGADMHTYSEYAKEKGGIEYWLGRAEQAGIKVEISEGSSLLKTATGHPYGKNLKTRYFYQDAEGGKIEFKVKKKKTLFAKDFERFNIIKMPGR